MIAAPKEAVFRALVDPSELNRYTADQASVGPRAGGRYDFGWGEGPIRILEIAPPEKLAYSWKYGTHRGSAQVLRRGREPGAGSAIRPALPSLSFSPCASFR